jgi:diguanylate cyclase (GGDEF)-like protein
LLVELPAVTDAAIVLRAEPRYGEEHGPFAATLGLAAPDLVGLPLEWPRGVTGVTVAYDHEPRESDGFFAGAALLPLTQGDAGGGTVAALWRNAGGPGPEAFARLRELAGSFAIPIDNARRHRAAVANGEIDPLTRLYNRRHFHETLEREIARAHRHGRRLTVVGADVDGFKALNERLGHLACDAILSRMGASFRSAVRTGDVPCRVGGDEFGVILTEAAACDAERFFARLRAALEADGAEETVTVSVGVAELLPDDDLSSVFERADAALYDARRLGRDRLAVAGADDAPSEEPA